MRESLAESLLSRVMEWSAADVAAQRPVLQALADYKYDGYEQYQPGMRFIESLARWLGQFGSTDERQVAYEFVRANLIYVSRPELQHLVGMVYPDLVRPRLLQRAAEDRGLENFRVAEIQRHAACNVRLRSTLYVGLSDGARTDVLRRSSPTINNEQVVADYHGLVIKAPDLLKDLREDLKPELGGEVAEARFSTLVLLDDFSASGISYLRTEEGGVRKGKIAKIADQLRNADGLLSEDLEIHIVLYVATDQAIEYLKSQLPALQDTLAGDWRIHRMQGLGDNVVLHRGDLPDVDSLIDAIYDPVINDKHMRKGGADGRYGFADCGLPVVLQHNTPNNSLAMLWADEGKSKALFPRVSRHREEA